MVAQCQLSLQAYARSIVHAASMLSVPRTVIKTVQDRIFKSLWKNKQDKVLRIIAKCQTISRNYAVVIRMFKIVNLFFWNNKEIIIESKSIASKRNLFRTGFTK